MRVALLAVLLLAACGTPPAGPTGDAEAVRLVRAAQAAHGTDRLDGQTVRFSFRGTPFTAWRDGGQFRYTRTTTDASGREVVETVANDGVTQTVGGVATPFASDAARAAAETAVNSVVYFALLPAALSDPAVRVRRLAPGAFGGPTLDAVEVTFGADGGGRDWEDRYVYWLHPTRHTVEAIAYSYAETPGDTARAATGHRLRLATDTVRVGGVRFQDYVNLSAEGVGDLEDYPAAFAAGRTFLVSEVRTEGVRLGP